MSDVNVQIVSLLAGCDWGRSTFPSAMVHGNGTPFTADEHDLILQARRRELEAVKQYLLTAQDFTEQRVREASRLVELTKPYYARPGVSVLADIEPLMTDAERAELRVLMDALAPDGQMIVGSP